VFHENLSDLLAISQFLSLNAPETAATYHLLNRNTLAQLPAGAIVVNTARGGLVDDQALLDTLHGGHITAAGLDVFESELNVNQGYLALANAFLLPHFGSATVETRTHMGMLCLDNIAAVLSGRPAPSLVKSKILCLIAFNFVETYLVNFVSSHIQRCVSLDAEGVVCISIRN
jgi:lactate dehydrogenase-like 2-hydroxyacid dehydrogenase